VTTPVATSLTGAAARTGPPTTSAAHYPLAGASAKITGIAACRISLPARVTQARPGVCVPQCPARPHSQTRQPLPSLISVTYDRRTDRHLSGCNTYGPHYTITQVATFRVVDDGNRKR